MNKSPGSDDITTEMLVSAGDIWISELIKLSNMMYSQDYFPKVNSTSQYLSHCRIYMERLNM